MDLERLKSLNQFDAESVETVVNAFYTNPGQIHAQLNRWLTKAQSSPQTWSFCWQLMQPHKPEAIQFFGINSLFFKISHFWQEVPDNELETLRDKLFHLATLPTPPHINNKICNTIGRYIMMSVATNRPRQSQQHLHDLLQQHPYSLLIQRKESEIENFLDILTAIAEQASIEKTIISSARFGKVLSQKADMVLQLTYQFLSNQHNHSDSIKSKALSCSSSWLRRVPIVMPEYQAFFQLLFQYLSDFKYTREAVDCILRFFKCPSNNYRDNNTDYVLGGLEMVSGLRTLVEKVFLDKHCLSHDIAREFCKLIVFVGESCVSVLSSLALRNNHSTRVVQHFMQMVVLCMAVPGQYPVEESCSDMTYAFWYLLQDSLLEGKVAEEDVCIFFRAYFFKAFKVMKVKVILPLHNYDLWSAEEKERFRCFRQDNADAVAYFQEFLQEDMVNDLHNDLTTLVQLHQQNKSVPWQHFEAVMYMLSSILEEGFLFNHSPLKHVFQLLHKMPCDNESLVYQIMAFIVNTSSLMEGDDVTFDVACSFLLEALKAGVCVTMASVSLKDLLVYNRKQIIKVAARVLETIKTPLEAPDTKSEDRIRMVTIVGHVVSVLSVPDALQVINMMLASNVQVLQRLYAGGGVPQDSAVAAEKLRMLAALFQVLKSQSDAEIKDNNNNLRGGGDNDVGGVGSDDGDGMGSDDNDGEGVGSDDNDAGGADNHPPSGSSCGSAHLGNVFQCSSQVATEVVPVVAEAMKAFGANKILVGECCNVLKNVVFCLQQHIQLPLLQLIVNAINNNIDNNINNNITLNNSLNNNSLNNNITLNNSLNNNSLNNNSLNNNSLNNNNNNTSNNTIINILNSGNLLNHNNNNMEAIIVLFKNMLSCLATKQECKHMLLNVFDNILKHHLLPFPDSFEDKDVACPFMEFLHRVCIRYTFLLTETSVDINLVFKAGMLALMTKHQKCTVHASNLTKTLLSNWQGVDVVVIGGELLKTLLMCISQITPIIHLKYIGHVISALILHHPSVFHHQKGVYEGELGELLERVGGCGDKLVEHWLLEYARKWRRGQQWDLQGNSYLQY